MENIFNVLPILLVIIFLILLYIVLLVYMMRRAVTGVIKIFRKHNALGQESAKSLGELGIIEKRSIADRLSKGRDYKPQALQFLFQLGVVEEIEDTRVYLSEEKLDSLNQQKELDGESAFKLWKLLLPRK